MTGRDTLEMRRVQRLSRSVLETLEARQMLSVAFQDGVLTVRGTPRNDTIIVDLAPTRSNRIQVAVNGSTRGFDHSAVQTLRILSGRGDDAIRVTTRTGLRFSQVRIDDGPGRDARFGLAALRTPDPMPLKARAFPAVQPQTPTTPDNPIDSGDPATPPADPITTDPTPVDPPVVVPPPVDPPPISAQPEAFPIYDATGFLNKPASTGMLPIYLTDREFYAGYEGHYDMSKADETATRALARKVAATGQILIVDIEHWELDFRKAPIEVVDASMDRMIQLVDWAHDEQPDLKVGFYGALPLRDYWTPYNYLTAIERSATDAWWADSLPQFSAAYSLWQAANDYLRPLADKVDVIIPSLYTFYDDRAGWARYAQGNLTEAARYGKPVLPFLWMNYHNSNPTLSLQFIPGDFWAQQLQTVRTYANGAIFWGGYTLPDGTVTRAPWDDSAGWWTATREFMTASQPA